MTRFREYAYLRRDPCAYCRGPGGTIDHIVSSSRGSAETVANLTGACEPCNVSKGSWPLLPYLLLRDWQ